MFIEIDSTDLERLNLARNAHPQKLPRRSRSPWTRDGPLTSMWVWLCWPCLTASVHNAVTWTEIP